MAKEMHYVEAQRGHTRIKIPVWGLLKTARQEAKVIIKNLTNHGWFGPEADDGSGYWQSPQHTTESIDSKHPHHRPFLKDA